MRRSATDESSRQDLRVTWLSLLFAAAAGLIALFWGPRALFGVWAGDLMCLAGYFMIRAWVRRGTLTKASGFGNYALRYCMYGLVTAACLWQDVPVLSLVAGIALQKAAVVVCPLTGKEGVDGAGKRH